MCYSLQLEALPQKYGTLHRNCLCSKLKVGLLRCAVGLTHWCAIQPDSSSDDLFPAVIFQSPLSSPWNHRFFLSMYVIAVKESGQALQKLGVSSHGVALHPEPFAVCTVFGIKISCGAYLQIICVMAMYLRMKELVSQIHRWTLLRLQSNWVQGQVPKALPFRSPALRIFGLHPLCQCWHRCVSKLLVFWGAVNTCPGGLDWDLTCPVCIILAKSPQMALTQLDSSYLFLTCD